MQKIALISLFGVENIGIRSISSFLQREGVQTSIVFFKRWVNNDIRPPSEKEKEILISLLRDLDAGIAGISFTSPFLGICRDITRRIKDALPIKVVWGGMHATACPEECLEYCDAVCRGEGEHAMLELARSYDREQSLGEIKNICFREGSRILCSEMRPLIRDLDALPYPDYSGGNKFFIDNDRLYTIDPAVFSRELRVVASRGCPFNCSYCYNSIIRKLYGTQGYHRMKSAEGVVAEIEHSLQLLKRVRRIKFDDDTFVFPREWVNKFCDIYKRRVKLPFEILFNAACSDEESLEKLKNAGLRRIQVGIQSVAAQGAHGMYQRDVPIEKIEKFAHISGKLGLSVVYDVILDNPLENSVDKEKLIDFLLGLPRPFNLFLYSLTIFPGTDLCELLLKKGLIKPENVEGAANKSFRQFRLSLGYPRGREELRFACLVSLTSKSFVPVSCIRFLGQSAFLKKHPVPLRYFAEFCNCIKLFFILSRMLIRGEVSFWKFSEYGSARRLLIQ